MTTGRNTLLSQIFLARSKGARRTSSNSGSRAISSAEATRLQLHAFDIARNRKSKKITLTTGLGLSDKGVPLRVASLLLPGLKMLHLLNAEKTVDENYVIYLAADFIVDCNGLDRTQAQVNAQIMLVYLDMFIDRFFPDIANKVTLLSHHDFSFVRTDTTSLAASLMADPNDDIQKPLSKILAYGQRRNSDEANSIIYAAANIILNGGLKGYNPLAHAISPDVDIIIPIGGKRERPFFELTTAMAQRTGCSYELIPIIVQQGHVPTYYPYRKGDILIGQSQTSTNDPYPAELSKDFAELMKVGADIQTLADLGEAAIQILNKKGESHDLRNTRRHGSAGQLRIV